MGEWVLPDRTINWNGLKELTGVSSADAADAIRYAFDRYYDINKLSNTLRAYANIEPVKHDYIDSTGRILGYYDAAFFEERVVTEDPDADFDIDTDALEEWAQEVCGE